MATPRRVRIRRRAKAGPSPAHAARPSPDDRARSVRSPNRWGTQRVRRLTMIYVVVLAVLYLGLALLAREAPGGASGGASSDLTVFGEVAFVVAIVGAVLTLGSAPSAVEVGPGATVVIGAFGNRRRYEAGPHLSVRVVRRLPAGFLAGGVVESVEVADGARRRTYLVDEGLLRPTAPPAD